MTELDDLENSTPRLQPGTDVVLEVKNLVKYFPVRHGFFRRAVGQVHAVDGVSLEVYSCETLGIVGESGSGKTTLGRTILRLIEPTSGEVRYLDEDVVGASRSRMRKLRRDMQIVFQDPYSSLNPRMPIRDIIAEPLRVQGVGRAEARERVADLLQSVGLLPEHGNRYPHEFSGGQRQRIGIARAMALRPTLVVLDEPVSALDVSIQAQVLNLLEDLQERYGLSFIFIAHDLSVVRHISDRVGVMYLGKMVEIGDSRTITEGPKHPYTQALISAIPIPVPGARRDRIILEGDVPSPANPPSGCRFHPRCPIARDNCKVDEPQLRELAPGHFVSCHYAQ